MALTDAKIKNAEIPEEKRQIKLPDAHSLYLLVNKSGKYWRFDYKLDGKRKTLSIGTYPEIPLAGSKNKAGDFIKGARDIAVDARALVKQRIDPSQQKQKEKRAHLAHQTAQMAQENTFEVVARKWFKHHENEWEQSHALTVISRLERLMFPTIGSIPIAEVTKKQITDAITKIVNRGTIDTAKRVVQITRNVFEFASDRGDIEAIPLGSTKNLVPARVQQHLPAITDPKQIGALMRSIFAYHGTFVVCQALKVLPYLASRSGEFRHANWSEFDFANAMWIIPAIHRKLKKEDKLNPENFQLVPLSDQAIDILKELRQLTGESKYIFPSSRGNARPMSENTINSAFASMGYKGEMVGHGVRSMFSTCMNTKGFNPDAIERQLAHKEKNAVRDAYNRSEYLDERKTIMQHWADYLDKLRADIATN